MKIEQIYTGCLAQGAYYIESQGEVAIIDPLREVQPYIEKAKAAGANIKYIFETHFSELCSRISVQNRKVKEAMESKGGTTPGTMGTRKFSPDHKWPGFLSLPFFEAHRRAYFLRDYQLSPPSFSLP